jgi:Ni,Fe-hydrogenase III large subunit
MNREKKSITGLFVPQDSEDVYIYSLTQSEVLTRVQKKDTLEEILRSNRFPVFLLRHSLGKRASGNDLIPTYSNFFDREQLVEEYRKNGYLADLSYLGEVMEVEPHQYAHAVGPIHAGIIEPGHFRFRLEAETILSLYIRLGFQRRNIREHIRGKLPMQAMPFAECISGDSTIAYSLAFSRLYEEACGLTVSLNTKLLRLILLEIERIAIHTGDIGAIAGDIGYYPLHGFCATDRGVGLASMEKLTGSRFGRSAILPGNQRINPALTKEDLNSISNSLKTFLHNLEKEFYKACASSTIRERLQICGELKTITVYKKSIVGMPLRATGMRQDLRYTDEHSKFGHPIQLDLDREHLTGEAWSRFYLRFLEIQNSIHWVCSVIDKLNVEYTPPNLKQKFQAKPGVYMAAVEGWRGPVLVALQLDQDARIIDSYIRDPSVLNWRALEIVVENELIGDFPLNNKSFSLSYVGVDL